MSKFPFYELVIFDLDGTLINTAPIVLNLLNALRKASGLPQNHLENFEQTLSYGGQKMIASAFELDMRKDAEEIKKNLELFRTEYSNTITDRKLVYPNVTKTLNWLKSKSFKLCICTNKPRQLAINALHDTGLNAFFDEIISSEDLNTSKPDPLLISSLTSQFGIAPEHAVLIGDNILDYQLAQNSKIDFIYFTCGYNNKEKILDKQRKFNNYKQLPMLISEDLNKT